VCWVIVAVIHGKVVTVEAQAKTYAKGREIEDGSANRTCPMWVTWSCAVEPIGATPATGERGAHKGCLGGKTACCAKYGYTAPVGVSSLP
jgi:hypothetical protein